ncbi:MAG: polyprenyl synthetase family protein [Planctomyces sp.]|nr:polyprenyl synthetase family protein [Planctomyces sp.]
MNSDRFQHHLASMRTSVEEALAVAVAQTDWPESLEDAVRYSLLAGGKRLRPLLVLLASEMFGGRMEDAMPAACAIEMIHTYSLIHDDLPSMDNDNYRRGRLTNHRIYGDAMAILAGDCLLTRAFELLGGTPGPPDRMIRMVQILAAAAGGAGMVGGQVLDLEAERGPLRGPDFAEERDSSSQTCGESAENTEINGTKALKPPNFFGKQANCSDSNLVDQLIRIHTMKTGALISGALDLGATSAGAEPQDCDRLKQYGYRIGLAFQIADDLLDITGDQARLGKTPGRDVDLGKLTYPAFWGIDESRQRAKTLISEACGLLDIYGERAVWLKELANFIVERDH